MLITPFHYGRYQQDTLRSRNHTMSCITKHSLSYLKRPHVDLNTVLITHVQQPSKHVFAYAFIHSANILNVRHCTWNMGEKNNQPAHLTSRRLQMSWGYHQKKQITANEWNACDNENIGKLFWGSWYEEVGTKLSGKERNYTGFHWGINASPECKRISEKELCQGTRTIEKRKSLFPDRGDIM